MPKTENFIVVSKIKGKLPCLPFISIKNFILGEKYELEVVFLKPDEQRKLNRIYRKKNKNTNILSFPLSKNSGEITFDIEKVKKEAKLFDMTFPQFLKYLFIHGCLHLKGFKHSSRMEEEEKKIMKKFC